MVRNIIQRRLSPFPEHRYVVPVTIELYLLKQLASMVFIVIFGGFCLFARNISMRRYIFAWISDVNIIVLGD